MPKKIATINIPDEYLECIDSLVNLGFYPSRCECVRQALRSFLHYERKIHDDLTHFHEVKKKQMESMV